MGDFVFSKGKLGSDVYGLKGPALRNILRDSELLCHSVFATPPIVTTL